MNPPDPSRPAHHASLRRATLRHSLHGRPGSALSTAVAASLLLTTALLLGGCNSIFYQPDSILYYQPHQFGLWHEEVYFNAADGTRLHGWFLKAPQEPSLGTVILFHGNSANLSNHLYSLRWLPKAGYSLFIFDYRGYGLSEGDPSRPGLIDDGQAAIAYVRARKEVEPGRLFVYGQSLGGAVALSTLARSETKGIAGMIAEGSFMSYQEVVRLTLDDTWITWTFQYPVAYLFFTDELAPEADLAKVAPLPLLVIHEQRDATVPIAAGRRLYEAYPGEDKEMWITENTQHIGSMAMKGSPWRGKLLTWMEAHLPRRAPPGYRYKSDSATQ